jgi:DHA1 family bicyclomycin/chloramphenicol resistance-like MFS transporter
MSMLMLVFSVSPILAPLAGSVTVSLANWRVIFWAVTVAALLGIVMISLWLRETRPAAQRAASSLGSAMAGYGLLLRDRHFLGLTFIGAFGMAGFFAYLANSSFVLIEHYGLTPAQYSVFFAVNAASFIGASQFNGRLSERYGLARVVRIGVLGACLPALALFVAFAAGIDSLALLATLVFVSCGFNGLVVPITSVMALDEHGEIAGTASALLGTLQMVTGALVMACIAPFVNGTAMPMVSGIAACVTIAFVLARLTLKHAPQPPARLTA